MFECKRLTSVVAVFTVLAASTPVNARNRKGDKLWAQAHLAENEKDFDKALTLSEQAVAEDNSDPGYQLEVRRVRFEAATFHVTRGQKIRADGRLTEGLAEFQKAYAIDPSLDIAEQEIRRTKAMIDREKKKAAGQPNDAKEESPEDRGLTPVQAAKKATDEKIDSYLPVPELRPLNPQPINLKMNNQKPRILFETVGKLAGINVLFDPEYENTPGKNQSIEFNNSTLEQALDYMSLVTHSFWKPISENTIFITVDNPTKRREYVEQVVKVFYLTNVTTPQELQEIITTLRTVTEIQKIFNYTAQNALIVRAEADQMALAEKIIADLDKPRAEVVVDVMVMEVNSTHMRNLSAAFATQGITSNISFTPRSSISTLASSTANSTTTNGTTTGTSTSGTTTTTNGTSSTLGTSNGTSTTGTSTNTLIPLPNIKRISTGDFSVANVPGALLEAVLNDASTRVLQAPQVRAVDNYKATLKIGDKVPTATGSFQPGVGGVGVNALVNTQFTFLDVGVNLEITPKVHDNGEVSLHLDVDISQVKSRIDLGGISQPVIGQRRASIDVRMREGEINLVGGLIQDQDTKTVSGVPGLGNIPILRRLFTSEQLEKDKTELVISIVPHIVRSPDITPLDLKGEAAGNSTTIKLNYAPRKVAEGALAPPAPGNLKGLVTTPSPQPGAAPQQPPATAPVTPPLPAPTLPPTPPGAANLPATPGAIAQLMFSPSQVDVPLNSPVTIALRVGNVTDLVSVLTHLRFDPKVLRLDNVVAGGLIQQSGPQLVPSKNILNDSGDATISIARAPDGGGVSGTGDLVTFIFQGIGKGSTNVVLQQADLRASTGNPIAASTPALAVTVK